jgi:phage tail-like protein
MGIVSEPDPLLSVRNFRVFLGSREVGFCHVEGLVSEAVATSDGERLQDRWRPVVLRRALGTDRSLFEWRERAVAGRRYPRDVALDQLDDGGERCVNTFMLLGAWPARWSGPVFDATSDGIAVEELELVHEGLIWMNEPGSRPPDATKPRKRGTHGRSA